MPRGNRLGARNLRTHDLERRLVKLGFGIAKNGVTVGANPNGVAQALSEFQKEHNVPETGKFDATTKSALANAKPMLALKARGQKVAELHARLTHLGFAIPKKETEKRVFGPRTKAAVERFQEKLKLPVTGRVNEPTKAALEAADANPNLDPYRVEGEIVLENSLPAKGVTVRVYNRVFGGKDDFLGETVTNDLGAYSVTYDPGVRAPNLEVRMVLKGKETPLSGTKFGAKQKETIYLVAPASAGSAASEFQRLTADMAAHLGSSDRLAEAKEETGRQDLTLLHQSSGWDARLIAIASAAARGSKTTGLPQDALYGLFRAGLPSDTPQLAKVSSKSVEAALNRAAEEGIVAMDKGQIAAAKKDFEKFSAKERLSIRVPGTASNLGDLLRRSGLSAANQTRFEALYASHQGTASELWDKAKKLGLSQAQIDGLKLQGKLSLLTLNNAPLGEAIQKKVGGLTTLHNLVSEGLYASKAWHTVLSDVAKSEKVAEKNLVPSAFENADDPVKAYSEDLARKVRMAFPTRVVAQMIQDNELPIGGDDEVKHAVLTFLDRAESEAGFKLGRTSVGRFLKEHEDTHFPARASKKTVEEATVQIKTLQRLYQITPTNEAMGTLLKLGFKSAQEVAAIPPDVFMKRYGNEFDTPEEARLVLQKSQQISAMVYNFATGAKQLDGSVPVAAVDSEPAEVREDVKLEFLKQYPTMKRLFGSLDFCECDHCRSVLSPAAYLVDLLQFLRPTDETWEDFKEDWKQQHRGADYDTRYEAPNKPVEVLLERRPDLAHLPLTCENTNTELPYIDVVNEILEYYVANKRLDEQCARDTGSAETGELLAEPQYVLEDAYEVLAEKVYPFALTFDAPLDKVRRAPEGEENPYPLALPFDLPIEMVRRLLDHFELPFWKLLETFRKTDELFLDAGAHPYYRDKILSERLKLAPAEYAVLTNSSADKWHDNWHKLYGFETLVKARAALTSAKTLSRRLGVTYKELMGLVKTWFVNPELEELATLRELGIEPQDVVRYKSKDDHGDPLLSDEEKAAFEKRLDDLTAQYQERGIKDFDANAWLNKTWNDDAFDKVLVLEDPDAGCSFERTELKYAFSNASLDSVLLRLNVFVRLWRKLGWSLEETDRALQAFLPGTPDPLNSANLGEAMKSALIYIAHFKELIELLNVSKRNRFNLLTLWSDIPTTGPNPLYGRLFLSESILNIDPVFDGPPGQYLGDDSGEVGDHLLALQAALNLTSDDIAAILRDAVPDKILEAPLTLGNVSLLYRYGILANALKLSVSDLITLKELAGLDPFSALKARPLSEEKEDYPLVKTLEFVRLALEVKEGGFKVEDLDYLLRHRVQPMGKHRPDPETFMKLVRTLGTDIARIDAAHTLPTESEVTEKRVQEELAILIPPDAVEKVTGLWHGSIVFPATKQVASSKKLDPSIYQVFNLTVSYDPDKGVQTLSHSGVLTASKKQNILDNVPKPGAGDSQRAKDAYDLFKELLGVIADTSQPEPDAFREKYFGESLTTKDLFADGEKALDGKALKKLLEKILPLVKDKLIRESLLQTMSGQFGTDPEISKALLTDANLLSLPSFADDALFASFVPLRASGVSVSFFSTPDASNDASDSQVITTADTEEETFDKPAGTKSLRFETYFVPPASETFRFHVDLTGGESVDFHIATLQDVEVPIDTTKDGNTLNHLADLVQGATYLLRIEVHDLGNDRLEFQLQSPSVPDGPLRQLPLYPIQSVDEARRAYVLLEKTLQISERANLSLREVQHLFRADDPDSRNLGNLPTGQDELSAKKVTELLAKIQSLLKYAGLRNKLSEGTDDLISVFELAFVSRSAPNDAERKRLFELVCERLAELTEREADTIQDVSEFLDFKKAKDFGQEETLIRVWEALEILHLLGVDVDTVDGWTGLVTLNDFDKRFDLAREARDTIKARYGKDDWLLVAQPIFDRLRGKQRDALAAYIMHLEEYERIEQLFEHFLIDAGMEPVVRTSRIQLAIASVQLYIQRCLLNLEERVSPAAIDSVPWEWMKRYRVWEANRKIFLYPENWLEPEFRDDKTHLFKELESALLQGEVSNELAENAFFQYLRKLESLAKLEIVAMYAEAKPLDPDSKVLHVIGRTYSNPHQYFYRRRSHGEWTAWEPVSAEIEGDHLVAVMWRDRLHLFWVTFVERTNDPTENSGTPEEMRNTKFSELRPRRIVDAQLNWCEYSQGQWTTREAGGFEDPMTVQLEHDYDLRRAFIHVSLEPDDDGPGAVLVHIRFDRAVVAKLTFAADATPQIEETTMMANLHGYDLVNTVADSMAGNVAASDAAKNAASAGMTAARTYILLSKSSTQRQSGTALKNKISTFIKSYDEEVVPVDCTFRVVSKNCAPEVTGPVEAPPAFPYKSTDTKATRYIASGSLTVTFAAQKIDGTASTPAAQEILHFGSQYALLPCSNRVEMFGSEIDPLVSPFFYQDGRSTFFVEPTFAETTIEKWEEWVIRTRVEEPTPQVVDWTKEVPIAPAYPDSRLPRNPKDPGWIDPAALYQLNPKRDWATDDSIVMDVGGSLIGKGGRVGSSIPVKSSTPAKKGAAGGSTPAPESLNGGAPGGRVVVRVATDGMTRTGLAGMTAFLGGGRR